jgi:hypothetical protein
MRTVIELSLIWRQNVFWMRSKQWKKFIFNNKTFWISVEIQYSWNMVYVIRWTIKSFELHSKVLRNRDSFHNVFVNVFVVLSVCLCVWLSVCLYSDSVSKLIKKYLNWFSLQFEIILCHNSIIIWYSCDWFRSCRVLTNNHFLSSNRLRLNWFVFEYMFRSRPRYAMCSRLES